MEYTFKKTNYCGDGVPTDLVIYDFGVTVSNEKIKALEQIESPFWTPAYIDELITEIETLTDDQEIDHMAEASHLLMLINSKEVSFYNMLKETKTEDFRWPTSTLIDFLKDFKKFIEENS